MKKSVNIPLPDLTEYNRKRKMKIVQEIKKEKSSEMKAALLTDVVKSTLRSPTGTTKRAYSLNKDSDSVEAVITENIGKFNEVHAVGTSNVKRSLKQILATAATSDKTVDSKKITATARKLKMSYRTARKGVNQRVLMDKDPTKQIKVLLKKKLRTNHNRRSEVKNFCFLQEGGCKQTNAWEKDYYKD